MATDDLHLDRVRAEGFGAIADDYDRHRPTYPAELIDDLLAGQPKHVLDVGCGTGKVAAELVRRGVDVLGVEPDARMAEVARGHGIPVEVAAFETWDDAGRRFDLITSGAAWQWVDPEAGLAKATKVLAPGGLIARFWAYFELPADTLAALTEVYSEHAPTAHAHGNAPDDTGYVDPFDGSAAFSAVEKRLYQRDRELTAEEWVDLVATYSDHQRLGPDQLAVLLTALREKIDSLGGSVHAVSGVFAQFAWRR